ncbi:hypothetical protein V6N13_098604 [Hibiscus sabdariffa]|uniref:Pentatricopeptide repeat-containing protein n=1 Tax=Hibiscus sabdariffa TaxID=183260 RepID=A0ABR2EEQ2_9ROSI
MEREIEYLEIMVCRGCYPDIVNYITLCSQHYAKMVDVAVDDAVKIFHDFERMGVRPNDITYNSIMLGLCKARQTDRAIDFLAYMVMRGCKPTESTYTIRIAYEGLANEALELLNELCYRGVVKQSSAQQVAVHVHAFV